MTDPRRQFLALKTFPSAEFVPAPRLLCGEFSEKKLQFGSLLSPQTGGRSNYQSLAIKFAASGGFRHAVSSFQQAFGYHVGA
jgi:hypothetical protein